MSKYTQGPWIATLKPAGFVEIKSKSGDVITDVCVKNVINNSRLIAAAPDLLEALERLTRELEVDNFFDRAGYDCWIIMAREAIVKARGGA